MTKRPNTSTHVNVGKNAKQEKERENFMKATNIQVGTFDGEMQATKELLAYENGLAPEDIQAHFVDK